MTELTDREWIVESWPSPTNEGGQKVGSGPTGVIVTHTPTQTVAACTIHRSQHRNRKAAMEAIEWMLSN